MNSSDPIVIASYARTPISSFLGSLSGAAATHLGAEANPLATVSVGVGNDGATEGAWRGTVLGTYSHGPALARNPGLADLLLAWATGSALEPIDDTWPQRLRRERLNAVGAR